MSETVRVMRLLIYEGTREWVEFQVTNSIHGTKILPANSRSSGGGKITAQTIKEFPDIIKLHEESFDNALKAELSSLLNPNQ